MTVMGRTSSDSSVDEQESTVSSNSTPRKSLDELLSQNKKMRELPSGSDFADMPSLSSYRAVDLSGSQASSLKGDCDMSLPSLSSFRMDDLSISSSYHSNYSNTNHLSGEESAEGWASFTSGNVSAETDSDADDESEFATKSFPSDDRGKKQSDIDLTMLPMPARSSSPPSPDVDVQDEDEYDYEDSLKDHEEGGSAADRDLISNARPSPRRNPEPEETQGSLPMRRPTRTVSPPRDERSCEPETSAPAYVAATASATVTTIVDSTPSTINARPPPRRSSSSSPDRPQPVERTESFLLSMLRRPAKEFSGSSSTLRTGTGTEGSSSSLRGGDSLPRLPRRTITEDDHTGPNAEGDDDDDDDDTRTSEDDDNTNISDDELAKISDDDISIESMSDFSIDTNDENDSVKEEEEAKPACERKSPSKKVATTTGDGEQSQQADQLLEEPNDQAERIEVAAAVAPENASEGGGKVENPLAVNPKRKSPSSVRSIEQTSTDENPDESGATSAEESGTSTTETEVDESEEINTAKNEKGEDKKDEKKRGKLLKRMSSSFRSLGKTASFRNSFTRIGKTASKLKQMGRKDDKNSSQPLPKRSQTQQDGSSKDV
jgi:hypothetical protein